MEANEATAANLRAALARRRITGRQLAELLDVSPMWAQRRLSGSIPITVDDLARIAAALDMPLSALIPDGALTAP